MISSFELDVYLGRVPPGLATREASVGSVPQRAGADGFRGKVPLVEGETIGLQRPNRASIRDTNPR